MRGLFITFEGGEGCGKSTQIERLAAHLAARGRSVIQLREPGGTPLGEAVRSLLQHDPAGEAMSAEAELLLFAASRAQLTRQRILPALEAGQIVLCDRFMDSTTVYQGVARRLHSEAVDFINRFAVGETRPDRTFLLDLPPEVGMARVRARGTGQLDRMEQEAAPFFEAVRMGYLDLAEREPERITTLDAARPADEIAADICQGFDSIEAMRSKPTP